MPFLRLERPTTWVLEEPGWQAARNEVWESLFTLANGYLGVRGFPEEPFDAGPTHPGVYLAGIFSPGVDGLPEMVNVANFLGVEILLGGCPFHMGSGRVMDYRRILGFQRGLLQRSMFYSEHNRATRLEFERFVSLSDLHVVGQSLTLTPVDWRGEIRVRLWLDASAHMLGRPHLRLLHSEHMGRDRILLATETAGSLLRIAHACRCSSWVQEGAPVKPQLIGRGPRLGFEFALILERGQQAAIERLVSTHTSRDPDTDSAERGCLEDVRGTEGGAYGVRRRLHVQAWQRRWERTDLSIAGPDEDQRAVRYAVCQLIQHSPPHRMPVSIAAAGLTGERGRGRVRWDTELLMLPFFLATDPAAAKRLLRYRTATLEGAKRNAAALGCEGVAFAYESADTGDETAAAYLGAASPTSRVPLLADAVPSHVTADVVYAAWQYVQITGDTAFRERELLILAVLGARFWASRVVDDPTHGRGEIRHVTGPDGYHGRVDNNAFTNFMAAWSLRLAAQEVMRMQKVHRRSRILRQFDVSQEEVSGWRQVAERLYLPEPTGDGVWEQHQGFFALSDTAPQPAPDGHAETSESGHLDARRMSQALQQADVLLLAFLFPDAFAAGWQRANWAYYEPRTSHVAASSPGVHSVMASQLDLPASAYTHFHQTAFWDLADVSGDTHRGLHLAALGGTWQAVVRGFLGLDLTGDQPQARPRLPASWSRVALHIQHRGAWYRIEATPSEGRVTPVRPPAGKG